MITAGTSTNANTYYLWWNGHERVYTGRHRKPKMYVCVGITHHGDFVTISGVEYCENCGNVVSQHWEPFKFIPNQWQVCTCGSTAGWCQMHGTQPWYPTITHTSGYTGSISDAS